jgi:copper homeostasis protein CutC
MASILRAFLARNRESLEGTLVGMLSANGRSTAGATGLTAAMYGAVLGVALQRALDPAFDDEGALDQLERLVVERVGARSVRETPEG